MPPAPDPAAKPSPIQPEAWGLGWPTCQEAKELFAQLEVASRELRQVLVGSPLASPYGRPGYSGAPTGLPRASASPEPGSRATGPGGVIVHFTAGPTMVSAVRWFCDRAQVSNRSSHVVIARDPEPGLRRGAWLTSCPAVARLPALPVQCRLPTETAVAGAWTNAWAYQIELVNYGPTMAASSAQARGFPEVAGQRWEPFTAAQLATCAYLVRCVRAAYGTFTTGQLFGHEHVQTVATPGSLGDNKFDPGPLFPWASFRAACRAPGEGKPAADASLEGQVLELLGYGAGRGVAEGARVAQYSLGLSPDGQVGPKTQATLAARVQDRLRGSRAPSWATIAQELPALARRAQVAEATVGGGAANG